ncbi:hypothetical protein MPSEU_000372700 [Mayamaea pseudoterrestris]|nr:hypothetical protein MPSEU_000372700 [Mayamaea pseudoterrestris]
MMQSLISIRQLCDDGCSTLFTDTAVTVTKGDKVILAGTPSTDTKLWTVNMQRPTGSPAASVNYALNMYQPLNTVADRVAYVSACLGYPTVSTLCKALDAGRLTTFPAITSAQVKAFPPRTTATAKGHLDQTRKNHRSTKQANSVTVTADELAIDMNPPPNDPPTLRSMRVYANYTKATGKIHSDLTGRFMLPSSSGNTVMLVVYDEDSNAILVEPMKNKSGASILAAYTRIHKLLCARGLKPQLQRLDNEASKALKDYMVSESVDYQLAPPHIHRRNAAERAIRTFINHFTATLCGTDPKFPLHLWDKLLPQCVLSLNLLRGSRINPKLSAHAQLHGTFDFNKTPLAPAGTRVIIHEKPSIRASHTPHGVDGYYLGPALEHYRCYCVYATDTNAERIADTLAWFPTQTIMPVASNQDLLIAAIKDMTSALRNWTTTSGPVPASDAGHMEELRRVAAALATQVGAPAPATADSAPPALQADPPSIPADVAPSPLPTQPAPATEAPTAPAPRVANENANASATAPRVPDANANAPTATTDATPPRVAAADPVVDSTMAPTAARVRFNLETTSEEPWTCVSRTKNPAQRRSLQKKEQAARLAKLTANEGSNFRRASPYKSTKATTYLPVGITQAAYTEAKRGTRSAHGISRPSAKKLQANTVTDPVTGAALEYRHLIAGPDSAQWERSMAMEIGRLA